MTIGNSNCGDMVEMVVSTTIHIMVSMDNSRDDSSMDDDESEYKFDGGLDRLDGSAVLMMSMVVERPAVSISKTLVTLWLLPRYMNESYIIAMELGWSTSSSKSQS